MTEADSSTTTTMRAIVQNSYWSTEVLRLTPLIEAGRVRSSIDVTYPSESVRGAMRYLQAGHVRGKLAITT
jgi:NADPH:quinone reductase-like Zn-dependent oxidoreductase